VQQHATIQYYYPEVYLEGLRKDAENLSHDIGSEVLTTMDMKSSVLWDITLYSPFEDNRRFGGTCCFPWLILRP
jgi:hypothetical protein